MTKLLEEAVARVRILPDDEQDRAAEVLMALAWSAALEPEDEATRAAIAEGLAQVALGVVVDLPEHMVVADARPLAA